MRILLSAFLLVTSLPALQAQSFYRYEKDPRISLILGMGLNNYYGELNDGHKFNLSNFNFSAGVQYPLTSRINLRGEMMFYKISGADKNAPIEGGRRQRNLSFRSNTMDLSFTGVFNLLPDYMTWKKQRSFNTYFLAGFGFTYLNPEAEYEGNWYSLRPLKTEGVDYKAIALVLPVGLGIKYNLNRNIELMAECVYRFTTTDYLDDVSTQYVSAETFNDPLAVILADRSPEVGASKAEAGTMRGNPDTNDGFVSVNVKVAFKVGELKPLRKIRDSFY